MKILSPAGNFECLKTAVFNGADEVYLGINEFNARNNVQGFTLETLSEAVDFAHVYGVKVLLAINIVFSDDELNSAVNTAVTAHNMGVDAFIIQDLGLIKLLAKYYPEIELHASTQMGIHNLEGVKALEKYNIKRVVLARETPLAEVKRIKENSSVELEYFCHGALCVSFSGNCYLSSYLFGMSGNRGRCKQLCRLPYTFEKNGVSVKRGYLLSAKDFNMSERLSELKGAGVDVIKIEGRARRPFYVATATREYYNALRGVKADQEKLKLAFNRNYTAGYLEGNGEIISNVQNHIGIKIGKVSKVKVGNRFNEVYFTSNREIYSKSVIKFLGKEETTVSAYDLSNLGGGKYKLTTTQKVNDNDLAFLIVDDKLEKQILDAVRKTKLEIKITAYPNEQISAKVKAQDIELEVLGGECLPSVNHPLTQTEIEQNFAKSQTFSASVEVFTDGAFMPKKELNDFRRNVYACAYDKIVSRYKRNLPLFKEKISGKVTPFTDFVFVYNESFSANEKNVVYSPEIYTLEGVQEFIASCEKLGKTPYLDTPNFALEKDISLLKEIISLTNIAIVANNYYALTLSKNIVIGGGLNAYNAVTASELGYPVITAESQIASRVDFPYMTLRHCPMKAHLSANCANCPYVDGYAYKMDNGKTLKLKRKKLSTCTFYLTDL